MESAGGANVSKIEVRASLSAPKSAGEHKSANRPGLAAVTGVAGAADAASAAGTTQARDDARAVCQRAFDANVSQALSSPDSIPRRSQYTRWSLVPCVKLSGTT